MDTNFTYKRRVEFSETDAAGILHFANFFRYMEEAEHAWWRSIGLSVHNKTGDEIISFPRVDAGCKFEAPLRFEDEVEINVTVINKTKKTIRFSFDIILGEKKIANGIIVVVCVRIDASGMNSIEIPESISKKIEIKKENI